MLTFILSLGHEAWLLKQRLTLLSTCTYLFVWLLIVLECICILLLVSRILEFIGALSISSLLLLRILLLMNTDSSASTIINSQILIIVTFTVLLLLLLLLVLRSRLLLISGIVDYIFINITHVFIRNVAIILIVSHLLLETRFVMVSAVLVTWHLSGMHHIQFL